jgi:hypothetical protein
MLGFRTQAFCCNLECNPSLHISILYLLSYISSLCKALNLQFEPSAQRAWSDGEDDKDDANSGVNTSGKKKPREPGGRKSKKKAPSSANVSSTSTPGYVGQGAGSEYFPILSHINAQPLLAPLHRRNHPPNLMLLPASFAPSRAR